MRLLATQHAGHDPLLVAFDVAAAFPSMSREAIATAMDFHSPPQSTRNVVRATHSRTKVWLQGATDSERPFTPGAGVPHGCPLSAILFVLTAHPLGLLKRSIPELECHMAYPDDLAAVLVCKETLLRLPPIFNAWHQATGMRLNHSKTTLIPLDRFLTPDGTPHDRLTKYVTSLTPPWNTTRARSHATYLGVLIGTDASQHMWAGP